MNKYYYEPCFAPSPVPPSVEPRFNNDDVIGAQRGVHIIEMDSSPVHEMWAVQVNVHSRGLPTFYLDRNVQGFSSKGPNEALILRIVDPLNLLKITDITFCAQKI